MTDEPASQIYDRSESLGGDVKWTGTPRTYPRFEGDAEALEEDLKRCVEGEVRFDSGTKAIYSTDASNYRQVPIGVVIPKDTEALAEAVRVCHEHGAPVTHRGCGTSLAGQCQSLSGAVLCGGARFAENGRSNGQFGKAALAATGAFAGGALVAYFASR